MTSRIKLSLLGLFFLMAGCDFQAASDAIDDLTVTLDIPVPNTVLSVGVVDANTGDFIPARVTFSGSGAASIVSIYSKPLSEMDLDGGAGTFGITNTTVPSTSSPFTVTVNATSPGYRSTSEVLTQTSVGYGSVLILMDSAESVSVPAQTVVAKGGDSPRGEGSSARIQVFASVYCVNPTRITPAITRKSARSITTWYKEGIWNRFNEGSHWQQASAQETEVGRITVGNTQAHGVSTLFYMDATPGERVTFKTTMDTYSPDYTTAVAPAGDFLPIDYELAEFLGNSKEFQCK